MSDNTFAILDYEPSSSLLYLAHQDGLVRYLGSSKEEKDVIGVIRSSRTRREALDSVLLYNGLNIVSIEDWDLSEFCNALPITKRDYVESDHRSDRIFKEKLPVFNNEQLEIARMLKFIFLPYLRRKWGITSKNYDYLLDIFAIPRSANDRSPFFAPDGNFLSTSVVERELMEAIQLIIQAGEIRGGIVSNRFASIVNFTQHSHVTQQVQNKYLRRAYAIICEEIKYFPVAHHLDEALELRNDHRVQDFRDVVWQWGRSLQDSDQKNMEKMRVEIRKANQQIQNLKKWRPVTRFLTYASLPVAFIPYIGLPFAALGAATQAYVDIIEKRHQWIMLGK